MDIIYSKGQATAADVQELLPDPPSYSSVRTFLRLLEEKGHLKHSQDGPRYVFSPIVTKSKAAKTALDNLVATFFGNSVENVVSTLLDVKSKELTDGELDKIAKLIELARKEK